MNYRYEQRFEFNGQLLTRSEIARMTGVSRSTLYNRMKQGHSVSEAVYSDVMEGALLDLPSAQPEQRWIPFKTRPLTEEEKEEHPEWDCILDCKLPDNGQRILVAIRIRGHEEVQQDEFYSDDGSYLDSGYEIGTEAVAWMPLPEPYREERTEE